MNIQVIILVSFALFSATACAGLERIINGSEAEPKELPYQVFYSKYVPIIGWTKGCGGTIISSRSILTAAHCLVHFTHLLLVVGATNLQNEKEEGQQRLIVDKSHVHIHGGYDHTIKINDIALIRLPASLEFDEYIQPVLLAEPGQSYANANGLISGWGYTEYNLTTEITESTHILQKLNVVVMPNQDCKDQVLKYSPGKFFPSSYICIMPPKDSSPCKGDTGGPLVIRDELNQTRLIGITSHSGMGVCAKNTPAIYTRVSSYLKWIEEITLSWN